MDYIYYTKNTCSKRIQVSLDGNVVSSVKFLDGGCPGNLQALPRLVAGMTVEEVEKKLSGINCGYRGTSCADQLSKAVREAYQKLHS